MINGITGDILKRVYDFSEMTEEELRCKFFQKLEECITMCNNTADIVDYIKNEAVKNEVNEQLSLWKDDGTLDKIINDYVYNKLKNEIIAELNITRKTFSNLPLNVIGHEIIEAKSAKSFDISLSDNISQSSILNVYFNAPVENGIVYDYRIKNDNTLSIRFTNVTDSSITLSNKTIDLKVIY